MGSNLSCDTFVNIMEQYRPDAYVGKARRSSTPTEKGRQIPLPEKVESDGQESSYLESKLRRYDDINRPVMQQEVFDVRYAAEKAGLWRFCDAVQHGGFNN